MQSTQDPQPPEGTTPPTPGAKGPLPVPQSSSAPPRVENPARYAPGVARLMKLRVAALVKLAAVTAFVLWKVSESGGQVNPFVVFFPLSAWCAFAAYVTDSKCPRCREKFFGNPIRFFAASSCQNCDLRKA